MAIASAQRNAPVREGIAVFGEIGLTGRLRTATQSERRLEECAKLGIVAAVAPEGTRSRSQIESLRLGHAQGRSWRRSRSPGGKPPQIGIISENKAFSRDFC